MHITLETFHPSLQEAVDKVDMAATLTGLPTAIGLAVQARDNARKILEDIRTSVVIADQFENLGLTEAEIERFITFISNRISMLKATRH